MQPLDSLSVAMACLGFARLRRRGWSGSQPLVLSNNVFVAPELGAVSKTDGSGNSNNSYGETVIHVLFVGAKTQSSSLKIKQMEEVFILSWETQKTKTVNF